MTVNEFRAWLEGFEASFTDGVPNAEQWKAIKGKLAKVAGLFQAPNNGLNQFPQPSPLPPWRPTAAAPRMNLPNHTVLVG